ncbi:hypothetical protein EH244_28795 [Variovorax beijingensis]|uniref:Uncharacterized protein n=1 Tax=Variovorax beijingensis TaxID=2496117 RepID=A0A3P3E5W5_9BURK|nr:hypothetical protein EH244_28795 [Variovorax beijingensis]
MQAIVPVWLHLARQAVIFLTCCGKKSVLRRMGSLFDERVNLRPGHMRFSPTCASRHDRRPRLAR